MFSSSSIVESEDRLELLPHWWEGDTEYDRDNGEDINEEEEEEEDDDDDEVGDGDKRVLFFPFRMGKMVYKRLRLEFFLTCPVVAVVESKEGGGLINGAVVES